ncbi:MAG: hypothetical protein WCF04_07290 [Candidatus Nanopelagicales bacterium]
MSSGLVEQVWLRLGERRVAVHVLELGLACCGVEMREARRVAEWLHAAGGDPGVIHAGESGPPDLHVLVVAGTVTKQLAHVLSDALAEVPEPRAVVAFGACASTGGPYWDSYSVIPGAHEVVRVDVWVPGCPPRPGDLVAALAEVLHGRP